VIGTYGATRDVLPNSGGVNLPQFPEPANPAWHLIALGVQMTNVCSSGALKPVAVNSSDTF